MAKMWEGVTVANTDKLADDFNSSISFDYKLYKHDILGSMAHASMLGAQNIISKQDADALIDGLQKKDLPLRIWVATTVVALIILITLTPLQRR